MDDPIPHDEEVRMQLRRLLQGKRFKNASSCAPLLQFVVEKALADEDISEEIIGRALFPGWVKDLFDDVRVNASHLRRMLSEYYGKEGSEDLVLIGLPKGPRYRPSFSYNPQFSAIAHYRKGKKAVCGPLDAGKLIHARACFYQAVREYPGWAPAYAGLAETDLKHAFISRFLVGGKGQGDLKSCQENAVAAIEADPSFWYGYCLYGAASACLWQWQEARLAFDKAMALNRVECERDFWYNAFLAAAGETNNYAKFSVALAKQNPEDFMAQLKAAVALYASEELAAAKVFVTRALAIDFHEWEAQLLATMINLAQMDIAGMHRGLRFTSDVLQGSIASNFSGLAALVESATLDDENARAIQMRLEQDATCQEDQKAMANMAVGQMWEAIFQLAKACDRRDPLMLWLHAWHIFKPLKEYDEFKVLTMRIRAGAV